MYVFYDEESNAVFILSIGSRPVFGKENSRLTSMSYPEDVLYEMAHQSRTTKVWGQQCHQAHVPHGDILSRIE